MLKSGKLEKGALAGDGESSGEGVRLAACSGTTWAAIVKDRLRVTWSGNVGLALTRESYPLPPGNVIAVGLSGPSLVMEKGDLLTWSSGRWEVIANIHEREDS